jgi:hypothetical protein
MSPSLDEEKMLGPVYHPVSPESKKKRSIRPNSAVKRRPSHFDIVNNGIQRVAMELGPSEKGLDC